jgi:hypothetical protein
MPPDLPPALAAALADRYRLERQLGAGGMATVFLAQDLKHDRQVAVKVLKPELSAVLGAERFVVEIKTTAALQHPHILPLFDSGEAGGFLYYVMPFIDGETLRDRLTRETQLGVEEAVRIAREVADALDYAHRQGVIHRDIKPENILLHDGRAMVADFGIAIAVSAAAGGRMTETGLSLGTPHYMSPEQATADKDLTGRSDIYSLASMLYEMLAGVPPHEGGSAPQTIMRIITETPRPLTELRKAVPPEVASAVMKALEKLPADRFATAKAFADALVDPAFRYGDAAPVAMAAPTPAPPAPPARGRALGVLAAVALVAAATGALAGRQFGASDADVRDLGLPTEAPMDTREVFRGFDLSRDGSRIVYRAERDGQRSLWLLETGTGEARLIPGTEGAVGAPFLSPDGTRVAFPAENEMRVASIAEGTVKTVGPANATLSGAWISERELFYEEDDGRGLRWVNVDDGTTRALRVTYCAEPTLLPDSARVLCGGGAKMYATMIDFEEPLVDRLVRRTDSASGPGGLLMGAHFTLVDDAYLVYVAADGTLTGTRVIDLDSGRVGRSVPLVPGVRRAVYTGAGQYALSADGTLAYVPGTDASVGRIVRLGSDGRPAPLNVDAAAHLRFSMHPGGRYFATTVQRTQDQELRLYDLRDGSYESVDRGLYVGSVRWSPDGRHFAYWYRRTPEDNTLRYRALNSPEAPRTLLRTAQDIGGNVAGFLSPDSLLVGVAERETPVLLIDPTVDPARVDSLGFESFFLATSPDRRWLAVQRLGAPGVRLQPWPARDRQWLVDADGFEPLWRSSTGLVYTTVTRGAFFEVTIDPAAENPIAARDQIVDDPRFIDTPGWSYAFAPDGDLLYLRAPEEHPGYYVRLVPGWVEQMKAAVDAANR